MQPNSPGFFLEPSAVTSCLGERWTPTSMRRSSKPLHNVAIFDRRVFIVQQFQLGEPPEAKNDNKENIKDDAGEHWRSHGDWCFSGLLWWTQWSMLWMKKFWKLVLVISVAVTSCSQATGLHQAQYLGLYPVAGFYSGDMHQQPWPLKITLKFLQWKQTWCCLPGGHGEPGIIFSEEKGAINAHRTCLKLEKTP